MIKGKEMSRISLLDQETIDKIAAGEVVERPSSVVKELVENAIDAGATAVTVEIREGGISLIRITDNGCGIAGDEVRLAFLRHSTSKIKSAEDLVCVSSLGFRGEALSSIAAVARVELITKTYEALSGTRYVIEGSKELAFEEVGAPDGTTFLVKDLFYNTPARRKFLKTAQTEGTYVSDMVEKLALSHPGISFKYINNNQTRLHTSGNGNCRDLIYHIYGRDIAAQLLEVSCESPHFKLSGYIGKPTVSRGNRNFENYFINGRYIKSSLLAKAIEEAYKSFLMQHQYPFTVLYFDFTGETLDVNVHPTKMELRFGDSQEIYQELADALLTPLKESELISEVPVTEEKKAPKAVRTYREPIPEPFEKRRINEIQSREGGASSVRESADSYRAGAHAGPHAPESGVSAGEKGVPVGGAGVSAERVGVPAGGAGVSAGKEDAPAGGAGISADGAGVLAGGAGVSAGREDVFAGKAGVPEPKGARGQQVEEADCKEEGAAKEAIPAGQMSLEETAPGFLTADARKKHRVIGQLFRTYWLIEYEDKLYIIDQHAAHEKVLYERKMEQLARKEFTSQVISPPIVLSLTAKEEEMLLRYGKEIKTLGYAVENFGGREYMINAVPDNLFSIDVKELFIEMLDDFTNLSGRETPELILEKLASMSCKAAVKGNDALSLAEANALIDELLTLDNPFHCPHGRPTIISMTKYELEKKFKRIL